MLEKGHIWVVARQQAVPLGGAAKQPVPTEFKFRGVMLQNIDNMDLQCEDQEEVLY